MNVIIRFMLIWGLISIILLIPYIIHIRAVTLLKNIEFLRYLYMRKYVKITKYIIHKVKRDSADALDSSDQTVYQLATLSANSYLLTYAPVVASCILSATFDLACKLDISPSVVIRMNFGSIRDLANSAINLIYSMTGNNIDIHVRSSTTDMNYSVTIPTIEEWLSNPPTYEKLTSDIDMLMQRVAGKYINTSATPENNNMED